MDGDDEIRRKALMAMKAVTAGALLCAGLSCFSRTADEDESSIGQQQRGYEKVESSDSSPEDQDHPRADEIDDDSAVEEALRSDPFDEVEPVDIVVEDDEELADHDDAECNAEESTGYCPEGCSRQNDVDCCQEISGNCWLSHDGCGPCVIPGPFVPPPMVV